MLIMTQLYCGKKSQLAKGDLMDGLTGQTNGFKLAGNQEKI